MRLGLCFVLALKCSACGQSHNDRVPENAMPRRLPDGEVSADFCMALGICPACNRILCEPIDRRAMRKTLIGLGWKFADPIATICPPGSAAVPFDWL